MKYNGCTGCTKFYRLINLLRNICLLGSFKNRSNALFNFFLVQIRLLNKLMGQDEF